MRPARRVAAFMMALALGALPALAIEEHDKQQATSSPAETAKADSTKAARSLDTLLEVRAAQVILGAPVLVRVGFRNTAGKPVDVLLKAPWHTVTISVTGPSGEAVVPTASDVADYASNHTTTIHAGDDFFAAWNLQQWCDLTHWGYRFSAPGRYTLSAQLAAPGGRARELGRPAVVQLTILPPP